MSMPERIRGGARVGKNEFQDLSTEYELYNERVLGNIHEVVLFVDKDTSKWR